MSSKIVPNKKRNKHDNFWGFVWVRFYPETYKLVIPLEKGKINTFPKKQCYFQSGKLVFY